MFDREQNPDLEAVASAMAACLGESPQRARQLALDWARERQRIRRSWRRCAAVSTARALNDATRIAVPDREAFHECLAHCQGGNLLLGMHQGDYINGCLALLAGAPPREILILRRKQASDVEQAFAHLDAIGHQVRVVRHGPNAVRELVRGLRRGATALLMFDLSPRWGATHPAEFLGASMAWALGPFTIAVLGRAVVLPYATSRSTQTSTVDLLPAIDCRLGGRPIHIQQLACRAMEPSIRRHPAQWHHWHLVPEVIRP